MKTETQNANANRYLNSQEIATMLGISVHYLRDLVADRRLPATARRFKAQAHERVPPCVEKHGYIRAWGPTLVAEIGRQQYATKKG